MIQTILKIVEEKLNKPLPELYKYNGNIIDALLLNIQINKITDCTDYDIANRFINVDGIKTCNYDKDRMIFNYFVFIQIYNLRILYELLKLNVNNEMIKHILKKYKENQVLELNTEVFLELFNNKSFNNAFFSEYEIIRIDEKKGLFQNNKIIIT